MPATEERLILSMNYKGVSCPVCKQEFKEGDDIVVCPVCGAPHHRACYHQLGHCALEQELHEQGRSWENPNDQPVHHHTELQPDENGNIICPNCGLFCKEEDEVCPNCQFPLKQPSAASGQGRQVVQGLDDQLPPNASFGTMFEAIYENDQIDNIPAKDFIFFVRQNYLYFLRAFKIFSQRSKAKVFNWAAFFLNFVYFFYRKMYKIGALLLAFYLISNIPSVILSYHMVQQTMEDPMLMYSLQFDFTGLETLSLLSQLFMYVRFGVALYCGFTANRHYYKHCRKKIQQLKGISTGNSSSEYYQTLSSIGGPSLISALLVIALVVGLVFSSSAIMAFFLM